MSPDNPALTHKEQLARMFKSQGTVTDRDMRTWCDFRKVISELRKEPFNMCIRPCHVTEFGHELDAYRYLPDGEPMDKSPIKKGQEDLFDNGPIVR